MTLETTTNTISHVGDGVTTVFAYDFRVDDADDMEVYLDSVLTESGWSIDGLGEETGGNVTFDTAPATDVYVTLLRQVPYDQQIDLQPYDPFPSETIENSLDKLTMQTQQLKEEIDRAIVAPPGSEPGVSYEMPAYDAGKGIVWSEEDPKELVNSDIAINEVTDTAQASADAAAASASAAASSASNASSSASDAATSESNAADSETNAATSETNAAASAAAAASSASDASDDADRAEAAIPTISTSEPSGGSDGDVWYQYTPGVFMATVQPGSILAYPQALPTPDGYLDSDGAVKLISEFPVLGALLGTLFGGDGITTFGLPTIPDELPLKYIIKV